MFTKVEKLPLGCVGVQTVDPDVIYYCFNSNKLFKKTLCGFCVSIRRDVEFCKSFITELNTSDMIYHSIRLYLALIPLFIFLFNSYLLFYYSVFYHLKRHSL